MSSIKQFINNNANVINEYLGIDPIINLYGSNNLSPKQYGLNKMNKSRRNKKRSKIK